MKFITLLNIVIGHSYYRTQVSPDLVLQPSPETLKLLKGYRLRFARSPGRLKILAPAKDDGTLVVPLETNTTFRFFLLDHGTLFSAATAIAEVNLKEILSGSAFLSFSNATLNTGDSILNLQRLEPRRTDYLQVNEPASNEAFFLSGIPILGLTSTAFVISGLPGVTSPSFYSEEQKKIELDTAGTTPGTRFSITYRSMPEWPPKTIALVEIHNGPSLANEPVFEINFNSLAARWRYYIVAPAGTVVNNNGETVWNVAIVDEETDRNGGMLVFSPTQVPTAGISDETDLKIRGHFANEELIRFELDEARTYQEEPYGNLKLTYTRSDTLGAWIISDLPNPSPLAQGIKIINLST